MCMMDTVVRGTAAGKSNLSITWCNAADNRACLLVLVPLCRCPYARVLVVMTRQQAIPPYT